MEIKADKKLSFSITPVQENDDQFEFSSCVTPNSPDSPADHLFLNGKLLPHFFPSQTTSYSYTFSRSTSRTSSVCSKDSVFSSRSNSTNSSRSSRSSTSTDQASDRKFLSPSDQKKAAKVNVTKNSAGKRPVLTPQCYGSSQRWQFIAPAPDFKRQASSARGRKPPQKKKAKKKQRGVRLRTWFGFRIFRAFMSACRECHAINPSPRKR